MNKHTFSLVEPSHIVAHSSRRRGSMQGFSLVELSIVLVILGLLTGGILTGQSLIRAAELRSITTQYQNFQTAIMTFRSKYFALPGDMRNAEDFWGTMTNCGAASPSGTGTQTCNGDGDGLIEVSVGSGRTGEMFTAWQHLANAGLIEGTYTGISGGSSRVDPIYGENSPTARISNTGWGTNWVDNSGDSDANVWENNYSNALTIGGDDGVWMDTPFISAEEAWGIDKKIDDGKPATGKMHTFSVTGCSDQTDNSAMVTAEYDVGNSSAECALVFLNR